MELRFDVSIINKIKDDLDSSQILDRKEYYMQEVVKRFNVCNENYIQEFDNFLNDLLYNVKYKDISIYDINKLVKLSNKISSDTYNNCIKLLKKICTSE